MYCIIIPAYIVCEGMGQCDIKYYNSMHRTIQCELNVTYIALNELKTLINFGSLLKLYLLRNAEKTKNVSPRLCG